MPFYKSKSRRAKNQYNALSETLQTTTLSIKLHAIIKATANKGNEKMHNALDKARKWQASLLYFALTNKVIPILMAHYRSMVKIYSAQATACLIKALFNTHKA